MRRRVSNCSVKSPRTSVHWWNSRPKQPKASPTSNTSAMSWTSSSGHSGRNDRRFRRRCGGEGCGATVMFGGTLREAADNDEIRMTNAERNPKSECTRGATSADSRVGISLYPYLSKSSQAAQSLVLVLVIGNGAVEGEDEKEDDDDLVAAPLRSAVAQSCCSSFPSFSSVFVTEGNEDNEEE